ncbi:MAG: threonine synthase [Actinobacteria bacterium]|nr:MAG: threonine synthase [Actinomycetota bacterium]
MDRYAGVIERYKTYLPVTDHTPVVTLVEGDTPLVPSGYLGPELGLDLYFKCEGFNPTGSFKDRGMTMAVSKAAEAGARAIMCASTGNTSASAAAFAARAGMKCIVVVPGKKIARGKLAQALIHAATVISISGNFDDALTIVKKLTEEYPIELVNSLNPYRIEGQKTAAFEVCDALGDAPDYLCIPVGNAGNITSYWKGFREYCDKRVSTCCPKMMGFQAAGAAPIVLGHPVENPETIATAIRIGNPARWKEAEAAARDSGGRIDMVTDEEIVDAYRLLAGREGIFCEPASAASVAGLRKAIGEGRVERGSKVVCVLTGHGLKDPDVAIEKAPEILEVGPTVEEVERAIGL